MWRRLLKLRHIARSFLFCRIGMGNTCSFWQDNWTGWGPLILLIGQQHTRLTGIPINATISQAIQHGHWLISTRSRNQLISFLRSILPPADSILHPSNMDSFAWTAGPDEANFRIAPARFSSSKTFTALHPHPPKVPWHKSIWFSGRIPKHAFTCWVIARDRLPTRDKIRRFSPQVPSICVLCHSAPETRDHLLFSCPYSHFLLISALHVIPPDLDFHSILQWLPISTADSSLKLIYHLLFQATAYLLWRERNARIHSMTSRPHSQLLKEIITTVKAKLLALSRSTPPRDPSLLQVWFRLQSSSSHVINPSTFTTSHSF
ncbi:hypothetical protein V5N11_027134 [Cardamine amara subsp. amara]|uniref:Reverse transcriptase zinc-binding domain-containing protein n=1 Tax=Cardamine amara subsp. amara TaxID=228776 RepID=A0ABD1B667_CARAN